MRIALVSNAVYPLRGGVELHVYNLARGLQQLGHEVDILTRARIGSPYDNGLVLRDALSWRQLRSALLHGRYDVVHAHGARSVFSATALIMAAHKQVPTIFTPHCFYPAQDLAGRLKRCLFDPTMGAAALGRSGRIICLTPNDATDAVQLGAQHNRIRIVPNSIYLPTPVAAEEVARWKQARTLDRYLLCVGRLDRVKGGDFLIRALARVDASLHLAFIGPDAGAESEWRELAATLKISHRTHFLGEVSDEELRTAYQGSMACVMASKYEGLPTVLLEAMALGTPVLAARTGGIGHLVEHGRTGFLYDYGDLDAFCGAFAHLRSADLRPVLAAARQHVAANYSWEANARRIADLYVEVAGRN